MLSGLRTFLMIVGFSVHNLFEGMAVGLEECRRGVWQLFVAIIVHSAAIMFTIGTDLVISGTALWRMVTYMMMVSAVTPAGVIVGLLSTSSQSSQPLMVGAMQGLAAGTLLYITFFEVRIVLVLVTTWSLLARITLFQVLSRDRLNRYGMSGLLGTVIVILAFAGMAAVSSFGGEHSHGHPGHAHQSQDSHHHHGDVKHLFKVNEESDSDFHHNEHDVVFDYENFHHGDHEHDQHHHHAWVEGRRHFKSWQEVITNVLWFGSSPICSNIINGKLEKTYKTRNTVPLKRSCFISSVNNLNIRISSWPLHILGHKDWSQDS